jgi:hypothetical protein
MLLKALVFSGFLLLHNLRQDELTMPGLKYLIGVKSLNRAGQ